MSTLRIVDAPLLPNVDGTEKIPTGGRGDYSVSLEQVKTFARGGIPQQLENHINDSENPHSVTKSQVGLGNVDNTSDIDKPISTATQEALNLKADKIQVVEKSVTIPTYNNAADGVNSVTGVANGAYFNVRSSSDDAVLVEYQNVGGSAVATGKQYLSALGVEQQEKPASTIKDASGRTQQEINSNVIDPVVGKPTTAKTFILNPLNKAMGRALEEKLNGEFASVKDGGAIGDGTLHTLQEWVDSGKFSSLAAIKLVYPSAGALTDSIDTVVIQTWLDLYKRVLLPYGKYLINKQIKFNDYGRELYSECVSAWGNGSSNRTSLIHSFNGDMITLNESFNIALGCHRIRGIGFLSNDGFSGCAISNFSSQNTFIDCSFYSFKDGAIKINGRSYGTYIIRNAFDKNGSNGKYDIAIDAVISATDYNTITVITDNIFETSKTGAINLKDSDPFYISGNYIEPFGSTSTQAMINIRNSLSGNTRGWVFKNYLGSLNGNGFAVSAIGNTLFIDDNIITGFNDGIYFAPQGGSCKSNQIKGYTGVGIRDASTSANTNNSSILLGNNLISAPTGAVHGILVANFTNGGNITSNIVLGKHDYYIRLLSAFNKFVEGNTLLPLISDVESGFGIYEDDGCNGNVVRNNVVRATNKYRRYSFEYDEFTLISNSAPTSGIWRRGSVVKVPDPVDLGAIGYICTVAGTGVNATWTKYGTIQLTSSTTYEPPSLATGAQQSTNITLNGVKLGDFVLCSFSRPLVGTRMWAEVTAVNTVTVYHRNDTGVTVDISSGTLAVKTV